MDIIMLQSMSLVVNERSQRSGVFLRHYCGVQNFIYAQSFSGQTPKLDLTSYRKRYISELARITTMEPLPSSVGVLELINFFWPPLWKTSQPNKRQWKIAFALNTDGFTANNDQNNLNGDNSGLGETRLGRIVSAGGKQLLSKLNSARKNFPMKVFLLLLGFYTANALATILGQTGDWDVLVAGVVVAAIEGIGMLMYKKPLTTGRLQSLVVMINYWKAGVCLGLFVDAFKLGS
ncbi:hypothetical protein DH2020_029864 [Rehmannia glutinosa]|uniref:Ycf20-like protein n=1 Tax=Rehmannia glutinosa TaxID=99300 RepID=A0ABR0VN70_REHGL